MDIKGTLAALKESSPFDVFIISFFLLPFTFKAWLDVCDLLDLSLCARRWSIALLFFLYVVGVVIMLVGMFRTKRAEEARDRIVNYLTSKNFESMSFETVRKNISDTYDDAFLEKLPALYPKALRRARLKGEKPGLARIITKDISDEA